MTGKPTILRAKGAKHAPEELRVGTIAARHQASPRATLAAALLGFFVITLDAVVVNVALPAIEHDFGAGVTGLQWVVDGYTLMFAALLLSAGSLIDRIGARHAFGVGLALFVAASVACGLAPSLAALIAARFLQGSAAAIMMPSSMALIGQAYPDRMQRGRAVAIWAMGGSVAATSGPVLGGLLTMFDWRWIFFINVPVGVVTLALLAWTAPSPHHKVPFDWMGQMMAVVAMGALTFGAIEAGAAGLGAPKVLIALGLAVVALLAFVASQARGAHPMVPVALFRSRNAVIAMVVGFTFMVGYFGLPFVMSLYLQQQRHLSALATGEAFLPMMLTGLVLTPFSARLVERFGARTLIATGLVSMMAGLVVIAMLPSSTPVWALSALMILVGLAGPLVSPPATAVLLNSVPAHLAGTASGVYNTSRQVGGALAVAVFGALLAQSDTFLHGLRTSLWLAAGVSLATAVISLRLRPTH
jgi:MFS transporter, DHA2 family, methylenomycin A resistance protein